MVTKDKDEELALFLEMRRRDIDKDKAQINLLVNSASVDASLGMKRPLISLNLILVEIIFHSFFNVYAVTMSPTKIQVRKTAAEKFLYSENDKSDYNW